MDQKLETVLREHAALRQELIDKSKLHVQIYGVYLSALTLSYGWIFTNKIYDIMAAIPVISIALLYRIIWDQLIINEISLYIKHEIEKQKIPILIGETDQLCKEDDEDHRFSGLWLGWQTSYYKNKHRLPNFYEKSLVMLFVVISSFPPIIYFAYNVILNYFGEPNTGIFRSSLSLNSDIALLVFDCVLALYTLHLISRHIIGRRNWWKP